MVTVKTYFSADSAQLDRTLLADEGIDSFVSDENLYNADPVLVWMNGGVRLMVAEEEKERAEAILEERGAQGEIGSEELIRLAEEGAGDEGSEREVEGRGGGDG